MSRGAEAVGVVEAAEAVGAAEAGEAATATAAGRYPSCLAAAGYDRLLAHWAKLPATEWLADVNRRASERGLRSAAGLPVRFSFDQAGAGGLSALAYERRVHDEGRVLCRRQGDGVDHDRWNAAVWLTWPRTKAALNRLHARDEGASPRAGEAGFVPGRRSRVRDFATLLDESGLAWVSSEPACDALLAGRRWRALFVEARADLSAGVLPVVIGHGLIGKLARPYKGLTAQALVVPIASGQVRSLKRAPAEGFDAVIDGAFGELTGEVTAEVTGEVTGEAIDEAIARRLTEVAGRLDPRGADRAGLASPGHEPAGRFSGSPCLPLPLLALPGWCDQNRAPAFYDDPTVFRPGKGPSPSEAEGRLLAS